jgi:HD-GYP domain-containing protein (c-di-GMP phosphodiesterase class II)
VNATAVQNQDEYEDLLSLWSDLESGLGIILGSPDSTQEFEQRVRQYDHWMRTLLERDTDLGLYLLFQLATNSPVGYSASHALVCAVLCHLIALELGLPASERDSLVRAALTMNIAMTTLQDQLAEQAEKPSLTQQNGIRAHAVRGAVMLGNIGVADALWLDTVALHHEESQDKTAALQDLAPARRLAHILHVVDRYAAMISPRKSREGRNATDSARTIVTGANKENDEVSRALVRAVGLCPPGTFVRMENRQVAVVMRRSNEPNLPLVAIVLSDAGTLLKPPKLHRTASGNPSIKSALTAASVQEHLNHYLILRLGVNATA